MAIAYDTTTESLAGTWQTGSSNTWPHTCTGTDRILFVGTFNNGNGGKPTGVTYGGVAMTEISTRLTDGGSFHVTLFVLTNPSSGANNVVVTWSTDGGINNCVASSYTGAKQTGQPDSQNQGAVTSSSSITISTTTVADNSWLVGFIRATSSTLSSGTNGTARVLTQGSQAFADSNGAMSPAGSHSMTINVSPDRDLALLLASFAPATASAPPDNAIAFGGGI